jgi:uncharacterized protein YgiM (DUF1202 family)
LSNGLPDNDTQWSLKPDEIGDLRLMLRDDVANESKLTIQLVTPEGQVLADTATIIKRAIAPSAVFTATGAQPIEIQLSSEQKVGVAETPDPQMSTADAAPVTAQKAKVEDNGTAAKWVRTFASMNLRKGPSASASIISVLDRGTKLREIARKKGWVQVSNPATSEKGWIYAGKVEDAH